MKRLAIMSIILIGVLAGWVRFYFVESFFNMVSLQEVSGAPPRSRLATEL